MPIQNLIKKQKELDIANQKLATKMKQAEYAEKEVNRWKDDKYIIAYARSHFGLIFPGEMTMHVSDPDSAGNELDLEVFNHEETDNTKELQRKFNEYKIPWYERIANSFNS